MSDVYTLLERDFKENGWCRNQFGVAIDIKLAIRVVYVTVICLALIGVCVLFGWTELSLIIGAVPLCTWVRYRYFVDRDFRDRLLTRLTLIHVAWYHELMEWSEEDAPPF